MILTLRSSKLDHTCLHLKKINNFLFCSKTFFFVLRTVNFVFAVPCFSFTPIPLMMNIPRNIYWEHFFGTSVETKTLWISQNNLNCFQTNLNISEQIELFQTNSKCSKHSEHSKMFQNNRTKQIVMPEYFGTNWTVSKQSKCLGTIRIVPNKFEMFQTFRTF